MPPCRRGSPGSKVSDDVTGGKGLMLQDEIEGKGVMSQEAKRKTGD
jgi:hypothetical protein